MTVREIAGAVGKEDRTVQRWVKKTADKMSSIDDKMSSSTSTRNTNRSMLLMDEVGRG